MVVKREGKVNLRTDETLGRPTRGISETAQILGTEECLYMGFKMTWGNPVYNLKTSIIVQSYNQVEISSILISTQRLPVLPVLYKYKN